MTLLAITYAGCARTQRVASEGERVSHPAGFSLIVPDGWTWTRHQKGLRLVGVETEGKGHPTIRIDAIPASELPEDFLSGRSFEWSQGNGSFHYRRWTNPLGHGDALTVHLTTAALSLVIEVERWSDGIFVDRGYYRREVWPILNSIEVGE